MGRWYRVVRRLDWGSVVKLESWGSMLEVRIRYQKDGTQARKTGCRIERNLSGPIYRFFRSFSVPTHLLLEQLSEISEPVS
jgi:hypothetical protein